MDHDGIQVLVIGVTLLVGHGIIFQFLPGLLQTGGSRVGSDDAILQVTHPFVQGRNRHLVELVDTDKNVFGEYLGRETGDDGILLLFPDLQTIARMHANKLVLAMIQIIVSNTQIEIEDTYGINLLDLIIGVAQVDMLRDGLRHAIKDTLQVIEFARVLDLDDYDLPLAVSSLDIHPVELIFTG